MRVTTTTWGQSLVLALFETPGGLNPAVKRIQQTVGSSIGTRTTFAKLQLAKSEAQLDEKWRWRAWLLLTAIGETPATWGIYDDAVPPFLADRIDELKEKLCAPRDSNSEPTDYRFRPSPAKRRPGNRSGHTGPAGRVR